MSAVNFIMDGRFNTSFSFNFILIKGKTFYTRKFSFTHSTDSSQYPDTARLVHSFNHNMLWFSLHKCQGYVSVLSLKCEMTVILLT